jgi:hypothetical protein
MYFSNIVIMQRSQSKILRAIYIYITNAPRYATNHSLHIDFSAPYVRDVIHERINKHHINLRVHLNPLLEPQLQPLDTRRPKRCWPLDLQGTWGGIAGWIPYHLIVIHGIVACLYNHHISLLYSFWLLIKMCFSYLPLEILLLICWSPKKSYPTSIISN